MKKKTIEKLRNYAIIGDKERASEIISELEAAGRIGLSHDGVCADNDRAYYIGNGNGLCSSSIDMLSSEGVKTIDEYLKIKTDLIAKEGNSKKELKVLVKEQASHIEELKGKGSEYLQVIEKQTYHINELLGEKKEEEVIEPKRGEVWVFEDEELSPLRYRIKEYTNDNNFKAYNSHSNARFNIVSLNSGKTKRLAAPEEEQEQELIKKEHENGKHWNGMDLIDIPEYVKSASIKDPLKFITLKVDLTSYGSEHEGMFNTDSSVMFVNAEFIVNKPSTKEAYDKQNEPKPLFENNYGKFFEGDNCFFVNKEKLKVHTCMIHKYLVAVEQENTSMVMKTKKQAYQWIKDNIEKLR